ncbi:hypothetical protein J7T55_000752 [Diaporthe amygdali]|uniref:uncharacterized protein n=1 Tax=Phomopsis amygdali TaxID=1214568 RepID=UPI0022FF2DC2|nr:uncharacterized protein J7T55_000752 [Diaporthe amygdali]KAJ0119902.1 hypothetical protein J7T55_000752 [Diaporthe amygdali]
MPHKNKTEKMAAATGQRDLEQALRPDTTLRASKQILDGLDFAHQAGLAHGDSSAANIVVTWDSIANDEDDDLFDILGDLYVAKAIGPLPSLHFPKEIVATSRWGLWDDGPDEDIRLIDWGAASPVDQTVTAEVLPQPLDLRAPETFVVGSLDYRLDLWKVGCVIYDLIYRERIFIYRVNDEHFFLKQVIKKVGPLPSDWRSKFEEVREKNKYADENGVLSY